MGVDADECDNAETNDCNLNALCNNTEGSYTCRCLTGYEGDGRICTGNDVMISIGLSCPLKFLFKEQNLSFNVFN